MVVQNDIYLCQNSENCGSQEELDYLNSPAYGEGHSYVTDDQNVCVFVEGYTAEMGQDWQWGVCGPIEWCYSDQVEFIDY